ncbi:MAG: glycosyl transferase [Epsilonproteobacteria bacterium]|nr:MAG: glycosyl transferase [Campylobacterota bacterium]
MFKSNYLKKIKYYLRYIFISDETYIKYKFKKYFGYELDFKNPRTINEKLQWLKLYDRTSLHTKCADKFEVREYVEDKIGSKYLIPLIFDTFNPEDINIDKLPDFPVVAKTNHARGVCIIRDKKKEDFINIQKKLTEELKNNFYYRTREWQYKNIKPRIIVEKLLLDENNNIPYDYKIWCMNGKVQMFQVDTGKDGEHIITFYDKDFKKLDFRKNYPTDNMKKPKTLSKMIELAEVLSVDFYFVRVDLYTINNKVYFGELTFHPEGGFGKFTPHNADLKLGNILTLPEGLKND